jgi:RNA polymerase sigma-70 factor (ECF subfamily)
VSLVANTPTAASGLEMPAPRRHAAHRERRLIRALRRDDPRAAELVSEAYGPLLRGFLAEALEDRDAVQDVLQQTLLEVWRRGHDYDPERASLATWLLVIARSRAIDHLRRRVPEPVDADSVAALADRDRPDETGALLERWRMAGMIAALPREEARMLQLRFYDGLTQREIAERTGVPLGTVKMRMVQALDRLRSMLDEEERR